MGEKLIVYIKLKMILQLRIKIYNGVLSRHFVLWDTFYVAREGALYTQPRTVKQFLYWLKIKISSFQAWCWSVVGVTALKTEPLLSESSDQIFI